MSTDQPQASHRVITSACLAALMWLAPQATSANPTITITDMPAYGADGSLRGVVRGVPFEHYHVAPYIQIEGVGWWTKPTFATPTVPISGDGTFAATVFNGALDNRATIVCVALLPVGETPPPASASGGLPASLSPVSIDCLERFGRTITFAGRSWAVKEAPLPVAPGDNRFSDRTDDVWVDSEGLHLTIRQRDGQWWSTEVMLLDSLGYGTYVFKTRSRSDILDANATLGMFTWDPYGDSVSPGSPHREIDFEDSRWGAPGDPNNTQAVVQPWNVVGNRHRFQLPNLSADGRLTRIFRWKPGAIDFWTLAGHQSPTGHPASSVIDYWTYVHEPVSQHYVPAPGRESVRVNLWLNQAAPADGQTIEVVITDFSFVASPADLAADFGSQTGTWILSESTWSLLHGLSPVAMVTGDLDGGGQDDIIVNFGPGVGVYAWMNHAAWTFIHPLSTSQMVTGDLDHDGRDDLVAVFPGHGVWRWTRGVWNLVHSLDATELGTGQLDRSSGVELILSFPGRGVWVYLNNRSWAQITPLQANSLLTADLDGTGRDEVVIDFSGYGLWVYRDNGTWSQLHPFSPAHVAAGNIDGTSRADLVVDFGAGYGLWIFRNDTTWTQLHGWSAHNIALGDQDASGKDDIIIDFGPGNGLWQYANDSEWRFLNTLSPEKLVVGRFH